MLAQLYRGASVIRSSLTFIVRACFCRRFVLKRLLHLPTFHHGNTLFFYYTKISHFVSYHWTFVWCLLKALISRLYISNVLKGDGTQIVTWTFWTFVWYLLNALISRLYISNGLKGEIQVNPLLQFCLSSCTIKISETDQALHPPERFPRFSFFLFFKQH